MKNFWGVWRSSILFRVVAATVLLSVLLITIVGSVLYVQISKGILREKVNESISESRSLSDYAQGQLDATLYLPSLKIDQVVRKILNASDLTLATTPREVALIGSPLSHRVNHAFNGASGGVDIRSIPQSLRELVVSRGGTHWVRSSILYLDGSRVPAIIIGRSIVIPPSSPYELYFIFLLKEQGTIIDFIGRLLLLSALLLVLLIGAISWYVIRQALYPIRDAAEIAEQLTAGDLGRRMRVVGQDEMTRLAISFNEMAVSMQQQISRLENLSRLQQRFVSDVSHELRTPLTTIRMASEVIGDSKEKMDPATARSVELLQSQITRFEALLTDLLEVSRFDARASILEVKETDITTLVRYCIDQAHVSESEQFLFDVPQNPVIATVDPRRIERIMRNLIANAIDHGEGKKIEITIRQGPSEVAVSVRDYGVGFTSRESLHLFDRFWRADPSRSRLRGGTGLGLSISLDDANLHQGLLKAWGAPGRGANFVLTVPKAPGIPIGSEPIRVDPPNEPSTIPMVSDEDEG
jgi:two-component system sensor histidine kinase MtrB